MKKTIAVIVAATAVAALGATAAQGALPLTLPTTSVPLSAPAATSSSSSAKTSSAGKPVANNDLFCGLWTQGSDRISGNSNIDHPSGASAAGQVYPYSSGDTCEDKSSNGSFTSGTDMFTWTMSHSNVNTTTERGTEHGTFMLASSTTPLVAGFNGQVTNYDFTTPITPGETPDTNGNRHIYYASGHAYDNSGSGSGAGNFNTHGGAATGQHFRGKYGTIVYQDPQGDTNSPCQSGSGMYCFEAILQGQTN